MSEPCRKDDRNKPSNVVLVTGFGPFEGHPVNASWEAVKELSKIVATEKLTGDYQLIIKEIPVSYQAIRVQIPKLWEDKKPFLVVHVGVSHLAQKLTLEQIAHNDGYVRPDVDGDHNDDEVCCLGGPCELQSNLRMDIICDAVNRNPCDVMAVTSTDAGRYLCDFIYYSSLNQDTSRVAFIHVPKLDNPYSAHQLAQGIKVAIEEMIQQLS